MQLPPKDTDCRFPFLKRRLKTKKISRLKLHNEFASKGWETRLKFEITSGESDNHIVSSPTKFYRTSSVKHSAHENCSKKKPMLVEISNIESVFKENKLKEITRKPPQNCHNFIEKLHEKEILNQNYHKKTNSESFNLQDLQAAFEIKKHGSTSKQEVSKSKNLQENPINKYSDKKYSNKNVDCDADSLVSSAEVFCASFSSIRNNSESFNTVSKNRYHKKLSSELYNLESPQTPFQIKNQQFGKVLTTSNHTVLFSGSNSTILTSYKKDLCFKNVSESFVNFPDEKCANKNSEIDINIENEHSPTKATEVMQSVLPSIENDCLNTVLKNSHRKRLSSEAFSLHGLQESFQSNKRCHESLKSSVDIITDTSPIKSNIEKTLYLNSLKSFKNVSESFVSNFPGDKCANETSNIDANIENENSPAKATEVTCTILPSFENNCLNTVLKNSHRKRRSSEAFSLLDFPNSLQNNKVSHDSLNSPVEIVNLITDTSPIKSNSEKNVCSGNLKNVSETFTNKAVGEKHVDKNCNPSTFIKSEFNPVCVKSTKVLDSFKSIPSFEDYNKAMNPISKDNEYSQAKSIVLNSKNFMKTLQSSFQDKSSSSLSDKGSNWLQSLNWDDHSQCKVADFENDQIGKIPLKNILHGGFAEQMLKLQRRERSDRVIWNHKTNELKRKAAAKSVNLTVTSILSFGKIIVTKCTLETCENIQDIMCNEKSEGTVSDSQPCILNGNPDIATCEQLENAKTKAFIVLFKRSMFFKLHMKIGNIFTLYPPWQTLSVSSLPFPVILCTYFVDIVDQSVENVKNETPRIAAHPVIYNSLPIKQSKCEEPVFSSTSLFNLSDWYGKSVCISARIQRIWKTGIMSYKVQHVLKSDDYLNFSILLQTKENMFLELKLNSNILSESYHQFLSDAEGKCYRFSDVVMSHRYNLNKCLKLSSVIQVMQNRMGNYEVPSSSHTFCYQFIANSSSKIPSNIPDENFPTYYDYEVKPLSFLQKNNLCDARFSCIGKILFQHKEEFYISDESLLLSKMKKYHKLKFAFLFKAFKQSIIGANVLVKEAFTDGDCLFVDQFSSCEILPSAEKLPSYQSRLKKINLITFDHVLSPLTLSSKMKEVVFVKGTVSEVDENSAMSWLECPCCFNENLLEGANSVVVYCEDCSRVVPKAILKVKMEVMIFSTFLSPAKVKIELLSSTVKRILKIKEDNYHPECKISDVLQKNTGDLCCYIKNIEITDKLKVFHLTEIRSN